MVEDARKGKNQDRLGQRGVSGGKEETPVQVILKVLRHSSGQLWPRSQVKLTRPRQCSDEAEDLIRTCSLPDRVEY